MFKEYFENLGNEMIKACKPAKAKPAAKEGAAKTARKPVPGAGGAVSAAYDHDRMRELIQALVPAHLKLEGVHTIDAGGYMPESVDYLAYREHFRNMSSMMTAIPSDLVYGSFFVNTGISATSLAETLGRVANLKKVDRFSEQQGEGQFIPAFILAMDLNMVYQDLKNLILDYYVSRSLDNYFEFDLLAIVNKGIVVKDWREKRSFKILDTGGDTMKWFFILMNEYMDVPKNESLDLRKYIRDTVQYREY